MTNDYFWLYPEGDDADCGGGVGNKQDYSYPPPPEASEQEPMLIAAATQQPQNPSPQHSEQFEWMFDAPQHNQGNYWTAPVTQSPYQQSAPMPPPPQMHQNASPYPPNPYPSLSYPLPSFYPPQSPGQSPYHGYVHPSSQQQEHQYRSPPNGPAQSYGQHQPEFLYGPASAPPYHQPPTTMEPIFTRDSEHEGLYFSAPMWASHYQSGQSPLPSRQQPLGYGMQQQPHLPAYNLQQQLLPPSYAQQLPLSPSTSRTQRRGEEQRQKRNALDAAKYSPSFAFQYYRVPKPAHLKAAKDIANDQREQAKYERIMRDGYEQTVPCGQRAVRRQRHPSHKCLMLRGGKKCAWCIPRRQACAQATAGALRTKSNAKLEKYKAKLKAKDDEMKKKD